MKASDMAISWRRRAEATASLREELERAARAQLRPPGGAGGRAGETAARHEGDAQALAARLQDAGKQLERAQGEGRDARRALDGSQTELRRARSRVDEAQALAERRLHEVTRLELELAAERDRSRELQAGEGQLQRLLSELSGVRGVQRDTQQQLERKEAEAESTRAELCQAVERLVQLETEVVAHDKKVKRYKVELKKCRSQAQQQQEEVSSCKEQISALESQLEKAKQGSLQELASREGRLEASRAELEAAREQLRVQEVELLAARSDGSRLHQESEQVISSVQGWLSQQRSAHEQLCGQVKQQGREISALTAQRDHLQDTVQLLAQKNAALSGELESCRADLERAKAEVERQETVVTQLRSRLHKQEHEQELELAEKAAVATDMHGRLRSHIQVTQQLNEQLSTMSKENLELRQSLRRQEMTRGDLGLAHAPLPYSRTTMPLRGSPRNPYAAETMQASL
ncbi:polyamine-modulated factor 1-binding protein 1-like [Lethenteron reissneri]|uniref:polyamine-modulated factor 1-binding protein 1-like n=1 Tax=Lethenteron reissneri TaxID=7753 RepID=UPI002AB69212|nr:polyamine-modulated factor 1-binding protein 1-like [Lethenteron reissneri]